MCGSDALRAIAPFFVREIQPANRFSLIPDRLSFKGAFASSAFEFTQRGEGNTELPDDRDAERIATQKLRRREGKYKRMEI